MAKFELDGEGDGLFGVVDETHWNVNSVGFEACGGLSGSVSLDEGFVVLDFGLFAVEDH